MIYRIIFRIKIALEILKGRNILVCNNKKEVLCMLTDRGCMLSNNINILLCTDDELEEKKDSLYYKGEIDL